VASTVILQGAQLPMRIYTVADGLAGNQINCIIQDSHGFIWLCTEEGLSRFDGYQFPNFGSAQGLSGTVNDLLEIRSGEYWVASPHGVYYFSPGVSGRCSPFTRHRFGDLTAVLAPLLLLAYHVPSRRSELTYMTKSY